MSRVFDDALARHSMQALKKVVGVAVAAELAALGGSYYAFHKLNTDPEFRGCGLNPRGARRVLRRGRSRGHDLPADSSARGRAQRDARNRNTEARAMTTSLEDRIQAELCEARFWWRSTSPQTKW